MSYSYGKEPVKCVTLYNDCYGNAGHGRAVAMCTVTSEEICPSVSFTKFTVMEPPGFKAQWTTIYYGLAPLGDDLAKQCPVGFYTIGSHYRILKKLGFTDKLCNAEFFENISHDSDYDSRMHTWYSDGLKLKEGISSTQTRLHHCCL